MAPSFFSLHGIGKLLETLEVLAKETNHHIAARVPVRVYSGRSPFVKAVVEEIRRRAAGRHFDTVIRYSVKLAEAASHGVPIASYCKQCAGFEDYQALTAEVLQQEAALPRDVQPSAPALTSEGVMFSLQAFDAARVHLAGDFNDWSLDGSEIEPIGGVWQKVVKLPPGRYRYRYVIDGRWQRDPLNADVEPSAYGGGDSILVRDERAWSEH